MSMNERINTANTDSLLKLPEIDAATNHSKTVKAAIEAVTLFGASIVRRTGVEGQSIEAGYSGSNLVYMPHEWWGRQRVQSFFSILNFYLNAMGGPLNSSSLMVGSNQDWFNAREMSDGGATSSGISAVRTFEPITNILIAYEPLTQDDPQTRTNSDSANLRPGDPDPHPAFRILSANNSLDPDDLLLVRAGLEATSDFGTILFPGLSVAFPGPKVNVEIYDHI